MEHPITPPPELMKQWMRVNNMDIAPLHLAQALATQSARWGADTELEACCEYLARCAAWEPEDVQEMLDFRRPKPPSLKEQALAALAAADGADHPVVCTVITADQHAIIRRALETLDD